MNKQKRSALVLALFLLANIALLFAQKNSHVPTPSEVLGFEVGADRKLAE